MSYKPFVHLHVHTEYSLLDGAARINKIFDLARSLNMPAVAMTDHGNMYGALTFFHAAEDNWANVVKDIKYRAAVDAYEQAKAADPANAGEKPSKDDIVFTKEDRVTYAHLYIKPIIGCEFYMVEDMHASGGKNDHLILLAKNEKGYSNLMMLNSLGWTEGYYAGKARIDMPCLAQHAEGLICLSACIVGRIPRLILAGDYEGAKQHALRLKSFFAPGDFYLEMQDHGIVEEGRALEKINNQGLIRLSKEIDVPLVVTNDAHYLTADDAEMHDVLLCIQTAAYLDDEKRMRFQGKEFYIKNYDEMAALFPNHLDALDRTVEIAQKITLKMPQKRELLPPYVPEDGSKPADYLRKMTMEGLVKRYGEITPEIQQRAEYELGVIIEMGFPEYYLIVWDFIHYAKTHDIPVGAGRGSGVGSIVAYAIGITNVDPLRYNLIFERFLNKERVSMPDFDVDICSEGRGKVIEYVVGKYGKDKVTQIITFGTLAAKQAIKDVARVFRIPFSEVEKMTKPIPNVPGCCLKGVLGRYSPDDKKAETYNKMRSNDLIELYNSDSTVRKIIDMAEKLEGMPRNTGMHAAGVVICSKPVAECIPLQQNDGIVTTQYPKDQVEELGMLKMDFLGLTNLTDLKYAKQYIRENTGRDIDFAQLGYEDPKVYELISSGETDAVFQLEGGGMKSFMRNLQPSNLEDIIAGISLYRPGPMDSIPDYVRNKKDPSLIHYLDPRLEPILRNTYGVLVYQEQVMDIVRTVGGYSYGRADILRRIMSKKKQKEMDIQRHIFLYGQPGDGNKVSEVKGALALGMSEENAVKLFESMASFAKYAFNKSHAAAYAVLSYETGYMKRYYPQEFITAVMNNRIDKPDEIEKYLTYLRDHGVQILPPCVNHSREWFHTDGKAVRFGLASIKGVGVEASRKLVEERNLHGDYKDLQELLQRQEVLPNKTMLESLIKSGAMDCFGQTRATLLANYEKLVAAVAGDKKKSATGQLSLFDDGFGLEMNTTIRLDIMPEMDRDLMLSFEKDLLNVYMSGHPLDAFRADYAEVPFHLGNLKEDVAESDMDEDNGFVQDDSLGQYANQYVSVAGMIDSLTKKPDKSGNDFVTGMLEDMTGKVEFVCFSRQYAKFKPYFVKRAIVRMEGRLSYRDGNYNLNVSSVAPWQHRADAVEARPESNTVEEVPSAQQYALVLVIDNLAQQNEAKRIVAANAGEMSVYWYTGGHYYDAAMRVYPSMAVLAALRRALGENGVVLKEFKK